MSDHVIVTGTAGFVGSHLAGSLLADGYRVTGIDCFTDYYDIRIKQDNLESLLGHDNFTFIGEPLGSMDLDAALDGVSCVFHQAAQAGVRASWGEQFETYIDCNIRATQRLCEAVKNHGTRIVYASSSSVYGETRELPMKEVHRPLPVSPYGVTKLDAENMCCLYNANYNVPVACLRYFTVYGPRQRPVMAFHRFSRAGLAGDPINIYGNGEQTRDFTFVEDIVAANIAAMKYDGQERVFNIGGGSRVTVNSVLDIIGGFLPGRLDVRYTETQLGDVTHTYADCTLANKELGYSPRVGLEEGIGREVEWIKSIYPRIEAKS